jgi:hypothetical protein
VGRKWRRSQNFVTSDEFNGAKSGFGAKSALRGCHFFRRRDGRGEFSHLAVCAETKRLPHLVECANIVDIALEVSRIPFGQCCHLGCRSSEQETSVATHELASEVEIVGQPFERINRVAMRSIDVNAFNCDLARRGFELSSKRYSGSMADDLDAIAEIDGCRFLFLVDLREVGHNTLHVQVAEGRPVGPPKSVKVANTEISDCTAIEITDESRVFEIIWQGYVGYSVLNESYATPSDEDRGEGNRFGIYSKSRFIQFMSEATFAYDDDPGPMRHYRVGCEDQILHVLAVAPPTVRKCGSRRASESGNRIQ